MLTPTQSSVFEYILQYRSEHGYSPTYGEIRENFGWASANASFEHVRALARHGYVKLGPRKMARAITPVENPPQKFPVLKDPSDTDWDQVCRDAERYRWLRSQHWIGNGLSVVRSDSLQVGTLTYTHQGLDLEIDRFQEIQHEISTIESGESAVSAPGDQHRDLERDTGVDQANQESLAALASFNKALMEDQE